jgi:hypothetical protein
MPYSVIDSPKKYFEAKTYTGTGSTQSISNLSFSPDLVWIKNRSGANSHGLVTSLVNTRYALDTSATSAEVDFGTTGVTSLNSDGFTVVSHPVYNNNGSNYISWNWRGSDSSAVSNTDGSITTTVSVNTTSGFSVFTYTGTGSNATLGHGLGVAPKVVFIKCRSGDNDWRMYHASLPSSDYVLYLNSTGAQDLNNTVYNGAPTSTTIGIKTNTTNNGSGSTYVGYAFAEVKGYSKFGSWISNGSSTADAFVYTGFKPSFVILKMATSASSWFMYDNKRVPYNASNVHLLANSSGAEDTSSNIDFYSNGFRSNGLFNSYSGQTIIYMAFAESPFVSSKSIPTTAR